MGNPMVHTLRRLGAGRRLLRLQNRQETASTLVSATSFAESATNVRNQNMGDGRNLNNRLKFLDLFAGGGGLSEGFIQAGFEPVAHVESDRSACFTLRTRMAYHWLKSHGGLELYTDYLNGMSSRAKFYQKVPEQVVRSVINAKIGKYTLPRIFQNIDALLINRRLDLIIGGPPCQAYSLVGRSRDQLRMKSDERNYLYLHYARFLEKYKPSYFVFENVAGLLSAKDSDGESHFDAMRALFAEHGYETEFKTLPANDYGVLQSRKRVFLVGRLGDSTGFYPEPDKWLTHASVKVAHSRQCQGGILRVTTPCCRNRRPRPLHYHGPLRRVAA